MDRYHVTWTEVTSNGMTTHRSTGVSASSSSEAAAKIKQRYASSRSTKAIDITAVKR